MCDNNKSCAAAEQPFEHAAEAYLQEQLRVKPTMTLEEQEDCKDDFIAGVIWKAAQALQAFNQPTPSCY